MSIPYLSGHPFLQCTRFCINGCSDSIVSIPYLSGHPFLHQQLFLRLELTDVCQSPIYRDTHFYTAELASKKPIISNVSIPYLSGHPFLRKYRWVPSSQKKPCQSPIYRDTHFYSSAYWILRNYKKSAVSIPYLSGHPFLHSRNSEYNLWSGLCQSPIYRDTHFYPHPQNRLILCGLPASILQVFIRQF